MPRRCAVRGSGCRTSTTSTTSNITPSPGSAPDKAVLTTTIDEKATGELTLGGGYSTDAGALLDIGLSERNLVGSGVSAGINGVLAQRRSSITASITDPYFLDRNLVVGGDIFLIQTNFLGTEPYDEKRVGFDVRAGYDFNEYLRQVWSYSLVGRTSTTSRRMPASSSRSLPATTVLSQVSQALTLDHRDSRIDPHTGYLVALGHRLLPVSAAMRTSSAPTSTASISFRSTVSPATATGVSR